jgi:hypothetical protein
VAFKVLIAMLINECSNLVGKDAIPIDKEDRNI